MVSAFHLHLHIFHITYHTPWYYIYILVDIIIYLFVLFFRVCLFVLIFCGYCNSIVLVYCTRLLIASWAFIWTGQGWMDGGLEGRDT